MEPTWEELKDQPLVAADAVSVSLPPTSFVQVTALDHDKFVTNIKEGACGHSQVNERLMEEANIQISSLKTELQNVKNPVRLSMYARARDMQFFVFLSLLADGCARGGSTARYYRPASLRQRLHMLCVTLQLDRHVDERSNTGSDTSPRNDQRSAGNLFANRDTSVELSLNIDMKIMRPWN